jgi:hypothetical protein
MTGVAQEREFLRNPIRWGTGSCAKASPKVIALPCIESLDGLGEQAGGKTGPEELLGEPVAGLAQRFFGEWNLPKSSAVVNSHVKVHFFLPIKNALYG